MKHLFSCFILALFSAFMATQIWNMVFVVMNLIGSSNILAANCSFIVSFLLFFAVLLFVYIVGHRENKENKEKEKVNEIIEKVMNESI